MNASVTRRDVDYLARLARQQDERIGDYADKIIEGALPWTRMRRVRALLHLAEKYGADRVGQSCALALAADMVDVKRLQRMVEVDAQPAKPTPPTATVMPISKYLRDPSQYALPLSRHSKNNNTGEKQ